VTDGYAVLRCVRVRQIIAGTHERKQRGEIDLCQPPPDKYPSGMRIYADGDWEEMVRNSASEDKGCRAGTTTDIYKFFGKL
jgi:hypothetical protein